MSPQQRSQLEEPTARAEPAPAEPAELVAAELAAPSAAPSEPSTLATATMPTEAPPPPAPPPPPALEPFEPPPLPRWKRAFDVAFALSAIVLGAPLLALIAALVKLTSPGPALFSQERYGFGARRFRILKFRKMAAAVRGGDKVTARYDHRLTPLGRILERTKLDELPQLWNILRGDMSVVGPRPEDPAFADAYPEAFRRILSTPPGVAGPNQVLYRNESELYPLDCADRNAFYVQELLPKKLEVDERYVATRGFFKDLAILCQVLTVTAFGVLPLGTIRRNPGILLHLAVVPLLVAASLSVAFLLRFDLDLARLDRGSYVFLLAVLVPVQTAAFFLFSGHKVVARYFNVLDLSQILKTSFGGTAVAVLASVALQQTTHSRAVLIVHSFLFVILGVFWMSLFRQFPSWWSRFREDLPRRLKITLAYAALGAGAFLLAHTLRFGPSAKVFPYPLPTILLAAAAINAAVFFALQGFNVLNRVISFGHHYEILKIVLASTAALYLTAFFLDVERGFPRSLLLLEPVLKYSSALILKLALARWSRRLDRAAGAAPPPVLLVGSLQRVERYLREEVADHEHAPRVKGVFLRGEFFPGMTLHSVPILGPAERAQEAALQLQTRCLDLED